MTGLAFAAASKPNCVLGDAGPEGGVAPGEEGVFAGVPAEEMRGLGVEAMMFARGPDFEEQKSAGDFDGAVQLVGEAAFFAAGRGDQGAAFGFEQAFLAFFGAEDDDQGYGVLGELGGCARTRLAPCCGLSCFALRHWWRGLYSNRAKRKGGPNRRQDRRASKRWRATGLAKKTNAGADSIRL